MNNPDVNSAERRLREIEERLENFEAPEAPEGLLASIQAEIPGELGSSGETGRPGSSGWGRRGWYRLAASLAVVAVGGTLGYRLLQDGAQPGDIVPPLQRSIQPVELGEPIPESSPVSGSELPPSQLPEAPKPSGRPGDPAQTGAATQTARQDGREIDDKDDGSARPVEKRRRGLDENLLRLQELQARQVPKPKVDDRRNVGGNESGQQSQFRDRSRELGERRAEIDGVRPESEALRKELDNLSGSDVPMVTAESPIVPPSVSEVVPPPHAPVLMSGQEGAASMQDRAEVTRRGGAPRREEIPELKALGYLGGTPSTGGTAEPNDQTYGDMFFQAYGTNPFIDTEDDAQSTFGIDVDTASYTMARSYLERGSLPPADAIRVEEFVNYFNYNDPAPRNRDFAVVAEGAPSPFASTARTYLLRFALKGREIAQSQRKAAVLTFVVDVSGSMKKENRLGLVKRALHLLVEQLDSGDAIGLVVYGGHGQVVLEPTNDHAKVMAAIDWLHPAGSTNAEEGLVLGYQTARKFFRQGAINRVILCSDGVANVGRTGPESILARIAAEAEQGIELTTVGFGMGNYNDVLMEQLADKGDGNYAYVDDIDAARKVFVENLSGTLETIAGDAKIQVEFDKQVVQSYRLLGYENRDIADRDFRNDAVDAGEIGGGHQVTALYEVKLRPDAARRGNVATLRLRYKSKRSGRMVEDAVDLAQSDLAASWRRASQRLRVAATAAEFAEVLKGSYWARDSDLQALAQRARELARSGPRNSELAELTDLIERAARLRGAPTGGWEDGIER